MAWPLWLKFRFRGKSASSASLTQCPTCGDEMLLIEKTTFTGDDMRTYRCPRCDREHIVNFGIATWKVLSDARGSDSGE
jgi:hypothetical protein